MHEIVTTFSEHSRAYEALARLKELAAEGQLEPISRSIGNGQTAVLADVDESAPAAVEGAMAETVEKVQAKLLEVRARLRHLVHH